jgi:hypothetical protein
LSAHQDLGVSRRIRGVNVGIAEDVGDATEDGVAFGGLFDDAAGCFLFVGAMMSDPGLAQHLSAKTTGPFRALPMKFLVGAGRVLAVIESVCAGAQGHERFARQVIVHEMFHLRVGPFPEAQEHDTEVRRIEGLDARFVVLGIRIDLAVLDRKQHRALKPMTDGQDFGQLRQTFFAAVFLIAGQEHDVFAAARALFAFVNHPIPGLRAACGEQKAGAPD